jgi:ribonuclease BN (tRNA processing enzyme)
MMNPNKNFISKKEWRRMRFSFYTTLLILGTLLFSVNANADEICHYTDYSIQLLGSGGPISDDKRASSGELIWWKGKPRILIDAGGGVYLRFGQSDARLEDVDLIAITHFHTDHVTDLPALLKGSYFFDYKKSIDIVGPTSGDNFPSLTQFINDLFNIKTGAYAYLNGLYKGDYGIKLKMKLTDIDYRGSKEIKVYEHDGLVVTALGIPHGYVPTLAYRIDSPEGCIVVSADQNGSNPAFIKFASNADILVMPAAITEDADKISSFMFAKPSIVGKIAAATNPKILVLNHFMGKGLRDKNQSIDIIKRYYHGPIYASRDLSCFPVVTTNNAVGVKP